MDRWLKVYDLAEDREKISRIQKATLETDEYGLVPDVALFGSQEWWSAVDSGAITLQAVEGVITKVYDAFHGGWPEIDVSRSGSDVLRWDAVGFYELCAVGKNIRIEYVVQRFKKTMANISHGNVNVRVFLRDGCGSLA